MSKQQCKYDIVIGIDPAGNHPSLKEGDGTTGIAIYNIKKNIFEKVIDIKSHDYDTWQAYYQDVWITLDNLVNFVYDDKEVALSFEDYLIYPNHAVHHTFSRIPTAMMLGYLLTKCKESFIDYYIRPAVDVKNRWSDDILARLGYIEGEAKSFEHCHGKSGWHLPGSDVPLLSHHLDAMRHALHCAKLEIPRNRGRLND